MTAIKYYWLVGAPMYTPDLYAWHMEGWKLFDNEQDAKEYAKNMYWKSTTMTNVGRRAFIQKVPVVKCKEIA